MRIYALVRKQNAPFFWGAVGAIGGSLVAGLLGNAAAKHASDGILSLGEQKDLFNYQQNRLEAQQNSAHQREVADLRAAGLNPILSSGGSGAASGIAAPIDANAYNSARTAANQQKIQAKLQVAQGLANTGAELLNYAVNKQNATSNEKKADAALKNAETNAANSASQIALNAQHGSKLEADAKLALDQLLNNQFVRENLKSQTAKNYASANEINYLLEPRAELMEAQKYSSWSGTGMTLLNGAAKNFRGALTAGSKTAKSVKNSAKDVAKPRKKIVNKNFKFIDDRPGHPGAPDYHDINKIYGGF